MTESTRPLIRDSYGELLRARTYSATAIHTPNPDKPGYTLCGGCISLTSEWECAGAGPCPYADKHNSNGRHHFDLTHCAGDDPQLCKRCERSVAKREVSR